jgi:ubiquinone/menaquinone biosynthesis C-methylase UbiE
MRDPTKRFSYRAGNCTKYRPGYPDAMVRFFPTLLSPAAAIADVGSGTGILTRQLLSHGYELYAVEPNEAMRQEAEKASTNDPHFHSVDGKAEATTLANQSVDFITCAQAFHWFDRVSTRLEFCRL